jgi:hypothetical protein
MDIEILLGGDKHLCEYYGIFLAKKNIKPATFHNLTEEEQKKHKFRLAIVFGKHDINSAHDHINDIQKMFKKKLPIFAVVESSEFHSIELLFRLGVRDVSFEFNPDKFFEDLSFLLDEMEKDEKDKSLKNDDYRINFFENCGAFFVDISGNVRLEKIAPLKLMFQHYLNKKLNALSLVVYVFSNTNELSLNFINIWTLFSIWKELSVDLKKVTFLTVSDKLSNKINRYLAKFGVSHFKDLLEIIKAKYPGMSEKEEQELFEFSSQLLQSNQVANAK